MSVGIYKLTSASESIRGHIELTYIEGYLHTVAFNLTCQLSHAQYDWLMKVLPQQEETFITEFQSLPKFNIEEIMKGRLSASEAIALFCRLYEAKKLVKYKVSRPDSGKMKSIAVTPELLEFYFSSDHWSIRDRQSIGHLVRNYNEIASLKEGQFIPKQKPLPNYYDPEFASKLDYNERLRYWEHLRKCGFEPIRQHGRSDIIGWRLSNKSQRAASATEGQGRAENVQPPLIDKGERSSEVQ